MAGVADGGVPKGSRRECEGNLSEVENVAH